MTRQPLAVATEPEQVDVWRKLYIIFNNGQHVTLTDGALNQLKTLYRNTDFNTFERSFRDILKKMLQSKPTIYFKTSCDFVCKFLQHVSKLSDELKAQQDALENNQPSNDGRQNSRFSVGSERPSISVTTAATKNKRGRAAPRRGAKRKAATYVDELVGDFASPTRESQNESSADDEIAMDVAVKRRRSHDSANLTAQATINNHDRLIGCCIDVAQLYMQVSDVDCRRNAVCFVCKFLSFVESLDEEICNALKKNLAERIRDTKPNIRAQAVLASRTSQDQKMIREAFEYHFYNDPEPIVRRALLGVMDTKVFGYDFLVHSTQDAQPEMRKATFNRLGKIDPLELSHQQLNMVLYNGFVERDSGAASAFKTQTLGTWLNRLYDGQDLHKLLTPFDIVNHHEDLQKLLKHVFERDLQKVELNGASTRLHYVVEAFHGRWLCAEAIKLPDLDRIDEKVVLIWTSLIEYCKTHQKDIKPVRIKTNIVSDTDKAIEEIPETMESDDTHIELFERIQPDLVHLMDFLEKFVHYAVEAIRNKQQETERLEYIFHQIMALISTYEVVDEAELKAVRGVFDSILEENLLTGYFNSFIRPIVLNLNKLTYRNKQVHFINYISLLINNVRSHLEDLATSSQMVVEDDENAEVVLFKNHRDELLKCLEMYYACLQNVDITQVPMTMRNHLKHLTVECLSTEYKTDAQVRSLMIACNGVSTFIERDFADDSVTIPHLLLGACFESGPIEVRTMGLQSTVDVICQHDDVDIPFPQLMRFLTIHLSDYGKYDPKTVRKNELDFAYTLVVGTCKLLVLQKIDSPSILSHLILWWYHPRTHSKLKQFIGIFLPVFVSRTSRKVSQEDEEDDWLKNLLVETFVTSLEYLHDYIRGPGMNIMSASDMTNLISFLCNLIPTPYHSSIYERVEDKMDELGSRNPTLLKYFKQSKNSLKPSTPPRNNTTLAQPLQVTE